MAARDAAFRIDAQPCKHVPAEAFDQSETLAHLPCPSEWLKRLPSRQIVDDLLDEIEALLDLTDANPHAGVDVTVVTHRRHEIEINAGRKGERFAGEKSVPAGAFDKTTKARANVGAR